MSKKLVTVARVKELIREGLSTDEMAIYFGRTTRAFYTFCSDNKISLSKLKQEVLREEIKKGGEKEDIAFKLKISPQLINKTKRILRDPEKELILSLLSLAKIKINESSLKDDESLNKAFIDLENYISVA